MNKCRPCVIVCGLWIFTRVTSDASTYKNKRKQLKLPPLAKSETNKDVSA